MLLHVVSPGETLSGIAARYDIPLSVLLNLNGLRTDADLLLPGQSLVLRRPRQMYTVKKGESLYAIAAQFGLSTRELYRRNAFLDGQSTLQTGTSLVITYEEEPQEKIGVNGYAYPYIDILALDRALPSLTYLTPFTYGINASGGLVPLGDTELLAAAGHYRVASLLHLSSLTEEGSFSNERSSLLLRSEELQENLLRAIVQNLRRKSFYGLDVDFEYVYPNEREAYSAFLKKLTERLNPLGYPVIAALAPKTSAEQKGLLYEAHDYGAIGAAVNAVFLMTYEWGYTYGPPMAVAPLPQVRQVLDYALSEIPAAHIFLGVPLYGYDWTLPYEQGVTKAETLSSPQALALAQRFGANIEYDERAQSPFFHYSARSGRTHEVWFEDARSLNAKLDLVQEYGLQGVGFWQLGRENPQLWSLLDARFQIETLL